MRRITTGILTVAALALAGCGGGGTHFANQPRPPSPVNLTVYINDQRVSISPSSIGAGPVVFIVSNQASSAQALTIADSAGGAGQPLADTGPISPGATAQVTVNVSSGGYTVATAPMGLTEAAQATGHKIRPALLRVGKPRPSSSNQLLTP